MSYTTARSFYFGTGTRRHAPRIFRGSASGSVVLWCGMEGLFPGKVMPSTSEPNCKACLRRRDRG